MKTQATTLYPFVPSGPDFALALRFFAALGFETMWHEGGLAGLRFGGAYFLLQDIDVPEWQKNQMITFEVGDLDDYWSELEPKDLAGSFAGVKARPPTDFPWGREIHIVDPGGVCWHVRQSKSPAQTKASPIHIANAWQRAASAHDVQGALSLSAATIEVGGPRGSAHGHQAVRDWMGRTAITLEPLRVFAQGAVVVVEQRANWNMESAGASTKVIGTIFRIDEGVVASVVRYDSLGDALAAAGLTSKDEAHG